VSASRLASRLTLARRQQFVGREAERDLFQRTLTAPDPPFAVLYVYGPGGIGKTTLLGEFLLAAERAGVPAIVLDGRDIDPIPSAFLEALCGAMGLAPSASPIESVAQRAERQVLLIDTYKAAEPLDDWIRETLIPQLPEQTLIILASSYPPAAP
jgi:predicted ATPase